MPARPRLGRAMTDNGYGWVARPLREALRLLGIRHGHTRPYTPEATGKAERFIQTPLREWDYLSRSIRLAPELPT